MQLLNPFAINILRDTDGAWLFTCPVLGIYGAGETPNKAFYDFWSMLEDQFNDLVAHESGLSDSLKKKLATMRTYIAAPNSEAFQLMCASETVLGKTWLTKEEDAAWAHLDKLPSLVES